MSCESSRFSWIPLNELLAAEGLVRLTSGYGGHARTPPRLVTACPGPWRISTWGVHAHTASPFFRTSRPDRDAHHSENGAFVDPPPQMRL